ncbi:MAG: hypothetical protein AAGA37_01685 [Actinomycetota bacterium]
MSSPVYRFVRITGLGTVAAFIYGLVRSASRKPTPPASGVANWEPLVDQEPLAPRTGPVAFVETESETATEPAVAPETATEPAATDAAGAKSGWIEPDADGGCPVSHPIKGNDQSKIFHVPGGMSYDRTKAERCYSDETSAEADGYRKAKR